MSTTKRGDDGLRRTTITEGYAFQCVQAEGQLRAYPNILDEDAMAEHVVVQLRVEWQPHLRVHKWYQAHSLLVCKCTT